MGFKQEEDYIYCLWNFNLDLGNVCFVLGYSAKSDCPPSLKKRQKKEKNKPPEPPQPRARGLVGGLHELPLYNHKKAAAEPAARGPAGIARPAAPPLRLTVTPGARSHSGKQPVPRITQCQVLSPRATVGLQTLRTVTTTAETGPREIAVSACYQGGRRRGQAVSPNSDVQVSIKGEAEGWVTVQKISFMLSLLLILVAEHPLSPAPLSQAFRPLRRGSKGPFHILSSNFGIALNRRC